MTYRQKIESVVPNKSSPDSAMWIENESNLKVKK